MENNENNTKNAKTPLIFVKKISNKHKIIPMNLTINTSGIVKHFTPSTQEWYNSIYTYNNNSMKNLSIADKTLSRLIKSYFNFFFNNKGLKSKRMAIRLKRLSTNKIFVSKADVKHTVSKTTITLYVYNEQKRHLKSKIRTLAYELFPSKAMLLDQKILKNEKENISLSYKVNTDAWLSEFHGIPLLNWISNNINYYFNELLIERKMYTSIKKNKTFEKKNNFFKREKLLKGLELWIDVALFTLKNPRIYAQINAFYLYFLFLVNFEGEFKVIKYYKALLRLNNAKFSSFFIEKLKPLVNNIYSQNNIHFNIVNLKNLYYNSDIFTQIIALKLKNRDNQLIRILRYALLLVKLPKVNVFKERYHRTIINKLWNNKVKNLNVNLLLNTFIRSNINKDVLNNTLLTLFSNSLFIGNNTNNVSNLYSDTFNKKKSLLDFLLNSLKHKSMAGVRLEIKGRLTRRFTASRSVFKIKWKGGIRNIDSSYRGLSTLMLRGHITSNVQYSIVNSKNRNGSFGLKGWIASK